MDSSIKFINNFQWNLNKILNEILKFSCYRTPLHVAIDAYNYDIFKYLLSNEKIDVNRESV